MTKAEDIKGTVTKAVFEQDRIKADLPFFKNRYSPQYLADIKKGRIRSVSIGFFWEPHPEKASGTENIRIMSCVTYSMTMLLLEAGLEGAAIRCAV